MSLMFCEICLTSADRARLRQRELSAFYALNPAFARIEVSHAWLCAFCWKRVSQCIHFIETAKRSQCALTDFPSESLLAGLKPTDLHPYKVRLLPNLEISNGPAETKLNHPSVNTESESRSGSRSSLDDNEEDAVEFSVVSQPVLPVLPVGHPVTNAPTRSGTNADAKHASVYTTSGYKLVIDPYSLMQVKRECAENLPPSVVKQEPEFVKLEMETPEEEIKGEPVELESNRAWDVPIAGTIASDLPVQKDVFKSPDDPRLKRVEMSEEDMLSGREESIRKKLFINRQFKCENCIIGFVSEEKYLRHRALHNEDCGSFECPICRLRFQTLSEQQNHTKKHYITHECSECGLRGTNRETMIRHYEESHQDDIYHCGLCNERFRSRRMWKDHTANVHNRSRECQQCGKVLASTSNLKKHMMMHDQKFGGECTICHKTFRQLDQHMRIHNREFDPEAYCAECDVQFKHIYIYRNHLRTSNRHTSPEFECAHCGMKCNTKNVLKSHIFTTHFKTILSCPQCNKKIIGARRLRVHIRTVHERLPQVKDKVCHICAKAFSTNVLLRNHMRRHTGERPFECHTCGDKFGFRAALYTHNKLKHLKLKRGVNQSTAYI